MSETSKSTRKRIKTVLTVKFMEGKTVRDMYRDFFKGKPLKELDMMEMRTHVRLDGEIVPYEIYKKFSGMGATRDFLESFEFKYSRRYITFSGDVIEKAIYELIPFVTVSGVASSINSYTLGADRLDSSFELKIEIETYSWKSLIAPEQVKHINKENARKLRHYLVSLPSVQGVPYSCTFREDEIKEQECSV